jgi:hypothetical protein
MAAIALGCFKLCGLNATPTTQYFALALPVCNASANVSPELKTSQITKSANSVFGHLLQFNKPDSDFNSITTPYETDATHHV